MYTMSMAPNKEELKYMIMSDAKMSDMEKLYDIFSLDKEELKKISSTLLCYSCCFR